MKPPAILPHTARDLVYSNVGRGALHVDQAWMRRYGGTKSWFGGGGGVRRWPVGAAAWQHQRALIGRPWLGVLRLGQVHVGPVRPCRCLVHFHCLRGEDAAFAVRFHCLRSYDTAFAFLFPLPSRLSR